MHTFKNYIIIPELKLMVIYFEGKVLLSDIIKNNQLLMEDPLYNAEFNLYIDFSDCMTIVFGSDFSEYIKFIKATVLLKKPIKAAYIISTPNHQLLFTIWMPISSFMNIDSAVFKERNLALNFMNFNEQEKRFFGQKFNEFKNQVHGYTVSNSVL